MKGKGKIAEAQEFGAGARAGDREASGDGTRRR